MHTRKFKKVTTHAFIGLSAISLLSVTLIISLSPQAVLVAMKLLNNDAFNFTREMYGGVGLTLFISLIYLKRTDLTDNGISLFVPAVEPLRFTAHYNCLHY